MTARIDDEDPAAVAEAKKISGYDDPEVEYSRDRAHRARGFKSWLLKEADGSYEPIKEMVRARPKDFPESYDGEDWMAALGQDDDLVALLFKAEVEWRLELRSRDLAGSTLNLKTPVAGLDFRKPVPEVRGCLYRTEASKPACGKPVIPGTVRCDVHGGELVDATTRRAVLMSAYLDLVSATSTAISALVDVATSSKNDIARVMASKEILDRAGLTAEMNINVRIDEGDGSPLDAIRKKLDSMQKNLRENAIDATARDRGNEDETVRDADVVTDAGVGWESVDSGGGD